MQHGHAELPQPGRCRDAADVPADEDEQGLGILLREHGEQPLQVDGESGRRQLLPETPEEIVVAPPVGDGDPEAGGVGLVDRARVVFVAPGETEIQNNRPEHPVRLEVTQYLPKVLQGLPRLFSHHETSSFLEERLIRCRTDDARDATDAGRGVRRQLPSKVVDGHEILRVQGAGYCLCGVRGDVSQIARVEGRLAKHDGEVRGGTEAEALQHVDEERDGGGVFPWACRADDLDAGLVELCALPAAHARAAVGREDVGELVRRRAACQALGDDAGYGGGHLRPQEEHLVVLVEELVRDVPEAVLLDHLRVLQRGRDDLPEPEQFEPIPDQTLHVAQPRGLGRQYVARAWGGGELSRRLTIHKRGYLNLWAKPWRPRQLDRYDSQDYCPFSAARQLAAAQLLSFLRRFAREAGGLLGS